MLEDDLPQAGDAPQRERHRPEPETFGNEAAVGHEDINNTSRPLQRMRSAEPSNARRASRGPQTGMGSPLTIHGVPNLSINMPQRLAQKAGCIGIVTWPPAASALNTFSASATLA